VTITLATTDADLQAVRQLFAKTFRDIAPDAVPFTREGHQSYGAMVAQAVDSDGRLQGAAMTCRAQIAVTALMLKGDPLGYAPVIDKHRELDLIAVQPDFRASGVGSRLVSFLEEHLVAAGVELLFGNATRDLDLERLRQFYERQGFTVGALGAPLPLLLGKSWTIPNAAQPGFYFYKMLVDAPTVSERQSSGRPKVVPPDPPKARRPKPKKKLRRR